MEQPSRRLHDAILLTYLEGTRCIQLGIIGNTLPLSEEVKVDQREAVDAPDIPRKYLNSAPPRSWRGTLPLGTQPKPSTCKAHRTSLMHQTYAESICRSRCRTQDIHMTFIHQRQHEGSNESKPTRALVHQQKGLHYIHKRT